MTRCAAEREREYNLNRQKAAQYEAEQASPEWVHRTVAIEGSLLLQDLRAPLHNALFCNWFNEYVRFGERDQISMSYVMLRMGLTDERGPRERVSSILELVAVPMTVKNSSRVATDWPLTVMMNRPGLTPACFACDVGSSGELE